MDSNKHTTLVFFLIKKFMRVNFEITFFFNHCGLKFEDQTLPIYMEMSTM
jgi:hypothetical protein